MASATNVMTACTIGIPRCVFSQKQRRPIRNGAPSITPSADNLTELMTLYIKYTSRFEDFNT